MINELVKYKGKTNSNKIAQRNDFLSSSQIEQEINATFLPDEDIYSGILELKLLLEDDCPKLTFNLNETPIPNQAIAAEDCAINIKGDMTLSQINILNLEKVNCTTYIE